MLRSARPPDQGVFGGIATAAGAGSCALPWTLGACLLGADRPGADGLGADRLGADTLGADTLGADKLGADRLGADRLGACKLGGGSGSERMIGGGDKPRTARTAGSAASAIAA